MDYVVAVKFTQLFQHLIHDSKNWVAINYLEAELTRYYLKPTYPEAELRGTNLRNQIQILKSVSKHIVTIRPLQSIKKNRYMPVE